TEVTDGTGLPASYDVRWAAGALTWSAATAVAQGSCKVLLAGTVIGARRSCTVLGLAAAKAYQFQLVAFRGTLNVNAVFGSLSNIASGSTAATTAPAAVAAVSVSPASVSLAAGASQQLTATLKDSAGMVLTGPTLTWASSTGAVATVNDSGLVTGVAAGTATISATSGGVTGTATVTVAAPVTNPGTVADLAVTGVTDSSVTLAFTEVTDGTGLPASYDVRWAAGALTWSAATAVAQGSCKVLLAGTVIGARRSCTVLGLAAAKAYQFQLVQYRCRLDARRPAGRARGVGHAEPGPWNCARGANATAHGGAGGLGRQPVEPASGDVGER
ncbi:MAG: hypothetical protein DMD41_17290, partial [Gemmatimonadetes bacterium]